MSMEPRHFHGRASEPIYTPPGFCAAAPLPPIKTRASHAIWPFIVGAAFVTLLLVYAAALFQGAN